MKNIAKLILALMVLASTTSCNNGGIDTNETNAQYLFFKPYMEWGSSKEQVSSKMTDCEVLLDQDNTLCYQYNDETIAYSFKNDKLHTVVVIPSAKLSMDDILLAFKGYKLLSQYDNKIFLDRKSKSIAEIENSEGYYTISWSQYGLDMANAVDLGLSVKWSDVNLDIGYDDYAALTPENNQEDVTKFFNGLIGWGDPTGSKKSETRFDYPQMSSISGSVYDVARAKWGGKWRIATQSEFLELINACSWKWEKRKGCYGYTVTGPNGNSIFLPTTGYRKGMSWYESNNGYYWTGTMRPNNTYYPYVLIFDDENKGLNLTTVSGLSYLFTCYGCAIRPVQGK